MEMQIYNKHNTRNITTQIGTMSTLIYLLVSYPLQGPPFHVRVDDTRRGLTCHLLITISTLKVDQFQD